MADPSAALAARFRDMAAKLGRDIEYRRAPRRENTPKQAKESHAARIEADHLERAKTALERLAAAALDGGIRLCGYLT